MSYYVLCLILVKYDLFDYIYKYFGLLKLNDIFEKAVIKPI